MRGQGHGHGSAEPSGTGAYGSIEECCRVAIREAAEVSPRRTEAAAYAKRHAVYQAIYPALQPVYGLL